MGLAWTAGSLFVAALAVFLAYRGPTLVAFGDFDKPAVSSPAVPSLFSASAECPTGSAPSCLLAPVRGNLNPYSKACALHTTDSSGAELRAAGFEDVVRVTKTLSIACAGNFRDLWNLDSTPDKAKSGACVTITAVAGSEDGVRIAPLPLEGFPEGVAFHPHGIDVVRDRRVYVINHAYLRGGERIDVFHLVQREGAGAALVYASTLSSTAIRAEHNGILNDVAVVGRDRLLVTSYLSRPDPLNGRTRLSLAAAKLPIVLGIGAGTSVLDCEIDNADGATKDGSRAENLECTTLADGFGMANGIATFSVAGQKWAAIVDIVAKTISFFHLADDVGQVRRRVDIGLTHAFDNLQVTVSDDVARKVTFMLGSIYNRPKAPASPAPADSAGLVSVLTVEFDSAATNIVSTYQADVASVIGTWPGLASGSPVGDGWVVAGSFREPGLMVCPVDRAALGDTKFN